ncbi:Coiled-coil domain-containing protein 167 [Popillia japonica]|uniref:Coiled-coil domain-containing protein 167 n=1 Tax=Popillia japonica TaxID=7064 RepID=A0AAW1M164_POPJA
MSFGECSLMKEISKTEDSIKSCYTRISFLEKKLEHAENNDLQQELEEVRKLLKTNEEVLHTLHKHNAGNFGVGIVLVLIIFIVWMIYILVKGNEF